MQRLEDPREVEFEDLELQAKAEIDTLLDQGLSTIDAVGYVRRDPAYSDLTEEFWLYEADGVDTRPWVDEIANEPVTCPKGHPTGRQNPLYDGSGDGLPFATGKFRCEVCVLEYDPRTVPYVRAVTILIAQLMRDSRKFKFEPADTELQGAELIELKDSDAFEAIVFFPEGIEDADGLRAHQDEAEIVFTLPDRQARYGITVFPV